MAAVPDSLAESRLKRLEMVICSGQTGQMHIKPSAADASLSIPPTRCNQPLNFSNTGCNDTWWRSLHTAEPAAHLFRCWLGTVLRDGVFRAKTDAFELCNNSLAGGRHFIWCHERLMRAVCDESHAATYSSSRLGSCERLLHLCPDQPGVISGRDSNHWGHPLTRKPTSKHHCRQRHLLGQQRCSVTAVHIAQLALQVNFTCSHACL